MNQTKLSPVVRVLPSLTDVAFLLPIIYLFAKMEGARTMLGDGDTGWHVRTGEWILRNHRVPDADVFSFTKAGQPWFAWEWLWDVMFAWLHQHWGMAAVVLASVLVLAVTSALLFRLILRKCDNRFIAIGITALAMAGSSIHWLARPHLFSMLFVVIFCWILDKAGEGDRGGLWALPCLMILWTNLHGGFFIGLIMIGTYFAGELALCVISGDRQERQLALARSKTFLITGIACFVATFVNPYFYHLHIHIYKFLTGSFNLRFINEYQSLSFQSPLAFYFEPMFFLSMVAAAWGLRQKRFAESLSLIGWCHLALFSARNLPIFMLIAAPVIARTLQELLPLLQGASSLAPSLQRTVTRFEQVATEFGEVDRPARLHLFSLTAIILLVIPFYTSAIPPKFRAEYDPERYPAKAIELLRHAEWSKRIFTHDEWGDYLIYHLYPVRMVFVDGRFDMYGSPFNEKYLDVMNVKYDWQQNLDRYEVDTILLPVDASLAGALKQSRRWRPVFDDGIAIVFRSEAPRDAWVETDAFPAKKNSAGLPDSGRAVIGGAVKTIPPDTKLQKRS